MIKIFTIFALIPSLCFSAEKQLALNDQISPAEKQLTLIDKNSPSDSSADKRVAIGSKIFTENILLAEMISLILEKNYGFTVDRKFKMGGTQILFNALRQNHIGIYPEYTGTAYMLFFKWDEDTNKPEVVYHRVKEHFAKHLQLSWSKPLGFENTYILVVRKKDKRFKNISLTSEINMLSPFLKIGMEHEFLEREDGFDNFSKKYNLNFKQKNILSMNEGLMYSALRNKKVDLIVGYSTAGQIRKFKLKTLEDDKNFFPVYSAAYLVNDPTLKDFPEIQLAFKSLEGKISQEDMIRLNAQVDLLGYDISSTARNFLVSKNILSKSSKPALKKDYRTDSWVYFYLSRKDYFFRIFIEHLILVFFALVLALLVSFPIGLISVYNSRFEKITFTIINILQTVPSLALLALLIPIFGIGFLPALVTLFVYSLLPMVRNIFEGIKNIDRNFIEVGAGLGLDFWQILRRIQIPLALPFILAGVRTSAVLVVGTAVLAALIGAGGLGDPIFRGIATLDTRLILMGAVPACLLALAIDQLLFLVEGVLVSKGLRRNKQFKDIPLG